MTVGTPGEPSRIAGLALGSCWGSRVADASDHSVGLASVAVPAGQGGVQGDN